MRVLIVIATLVAVCCAQGVRDLKLERRCSEVDGFTGRSENDAIGVFYRMGTKMTCASGLMWFQSICTCSWIPGQQLQLFRRQCDTYMDSTFIESTDILNAFGNKAIEYSGAEGDRFKDNENRLCFRNRAMQGIYALSGNDYGNTFIIDTLLLISGLSTTSPTNSPIAIIRNGACLNGEGIQDTLFLTYQQLDDTYMVAMGGETASCSPRVRDSRGNSISRGLSTTRNDRLRIVYDNNQVTLIVNNGDNSGPGGCSNGPVGSRQFSRYLGKLAGTDCNMMFGNVNDSPYTICFQELTITRDCQV